MLHLDLDDDELSLAGLGLRYLLLGLAGGVAFIFGILAYVLVARVAFGF